MKGLIIIILTITCMVQARTHEGPNMFASYEECVSAYETGKFEYYHPKYFDHFKDDPVNGSTRIVAPLTADTIAYMWTVNGPQWVVLEKSTLLRKYLGTPYAYHECGNKIYECRPTEKVITTLKAARITELPTVSIVIVNPPRDRHEYPRERQTVSKTDWTPWIVVGILAGGLIYALSQKDHDVISGRPPGVSTGGAGPGVGTGGAGPGVSKLFPPTFRVGVGLSF